MAVSIEKLFDRYSALANEAKDLKAQVKDLEKEQALIEKQLMASIPENGVKAGVQHIVTTRTSVSYAKALAAIQEKLLPKAKLVEARVIVEEFTERREQHSFKAV